MSNTYTQLYVHVIFSTYKREKSIRNRFKTELYKYITGIIRNREQKLLAINGTSDHIHIFIGFNPNIAISDLVRDIKHYSTLFLRDRKNVNNFKWQEGFGAFTYSYSQIETVIEYIKNQKSHHKHSSFKEEYLKFLNKFNVDFDEKYLFDE